MTVTAAIKARLVELSALTALVSTRIYVETLPQKPTLPAIRIQRISEFADVHLRGAQAMRRARVQVDAVASSLETATAVAEAAHGDGAGSGLSGWQGTVGGSPGETVFAILPADARTDYDAEELRQWRVSRDYLVWMR